MEINFCTGRIDFQGLYAHTIGSNFHDFEWYFSSSELESLEGWDVPLEDIPDEQVEITPAYTEAFDWYFQGSSEKYRGLEINFNSGLLFETADDSELASAYSNWFAEEQIAQKQEEYTYCENCQRTQKRRRMNDTTIAPETSYEQTFLVCDDCIGDDVWESSKERELRREYLEDEFENIDPKRLLLENLKNPKEADPGWLIIAEKALSDSLDRGGIMAQWVLNDFSEGSELTFYEALIRCISAWRRHHETNYEDLLAQGFDREDARQHAK